MSRRMGGEVAWWCPSFENSGNGTAFLTDFVGSNVATLTNMDPASDWVPDTANGGVRALDFDYVAGASRQAVQLSNSVSVSNYATASLSLWCLLQAAPANNAGLYYESTSSDGFSKFAIFQLTNNQVLFIARDTASGSSFSITASPPTGQWIHLCGCYDANTDRMELFVNGVSVGTNLTAKGVLHNSTPASPIAIGAFTQNATAQYSCNALIDDVRLFSRVLTQTEITALASQRGYRVPLTIDMGGEVLWICPSLDSVGNGTTIARDLMGTGNNGTLTNMDPPTDWVSDTANGGTRAIDFDGVNDYLTVTDAVSLDVTGAITLCAWIKSDGNYGTNGKGIISKYETATNQRSYALLLTSSGNVQFAVTPDGTSASVRAEWGSTVVGTNWRHVAATYVPSTGTVAIYVDGVAESRSNNGGPLPSSIHGGSAPLWVGVVSTLGSNLFFGGRIDDARVFNRALTQTEITALASQRGYQRPTVNGIGGEALWICPSLDTFGNGTLLARDLSNNRNHGVMTGMAIGDWVADTNNGGIRALDFDGVNDRLDFGQSAIIQYGAFSISWWERIPSPGTNSFYPQIALRTSASSVFLVYRANLANYTFLTWKETTSTSGAGLRASSASSISAVANQWRHFVLVGQDVKSGNSSLFTVYENGVPLSITSAGNFAAATFVNNIGSDGVGTFSLTQLDDVRIIPRAITAAEVAVLYTQRGYQRPSNTRRRRQPRGFGL